ncbi:MAG: GIY-YIG nuclease family protein [Candidatus Omnitrophica bacterium]|nr:GIY-YIG nuclease family protein [Candidatus Omnitrophota bacterium]
MTWHVYILECKNKSFYTGITNDLEQRLKKHQHGLGAKYTRAFGADKFVYTEDFSTRSDALKREAKIKGLTRDMKEALINGALPRSSS